jgi:hypothetical protein
MSLASAEESAASLFRLIVHAGNIFGRSKNSDARRLAGHRMQ